jgi:predicted MFS family arabinose efflux permease
MTPDPASALKTGFRRLAWSNFAAQSAEQIALAAAPLVAVVTLGADAAETGVLQTVLTLPFVLFAIPAGLMTDRLSRRRLMAGAEALRALALLAILVLAALGQLTWPILAVLGFVSVCGTVVFSVAAPALVPALVPADTLSTANARIELARTLAFAAGPALGGALVGWTGAGTAFGLAAALSCAAALLLARIMEPPRQPAPRRHPVLDIREGAAFVLRHQLLRPVFVTQFVYNIAFFVVLAVFVPYAVQRLSLSESAIGVILGMLGVGMVIGALLAPRILRAVPFGVVIGVGPICGFAASVVMMATIAWPRAELAGLSFFLLGCGPILWTISTTTLRQAVTPTALLGRVSAINILSYSARPVGAGLAALIAAAHGMEACLGVAVAIFAVQAAVILLSPAVRLTRQPQPEAQIPPSQPRPDVMSFRVENYARRV